MIRLNSADLPPSGRKCASSEPRFPSGDRHAATQLNCAFVDQPAEPLRHGFLGSRELILPGGHPGHFAVGDHAGGHRFEEQFAERHGTDAVEITLVGLPGGCMTCSPFFMPKDALQGPVDLVAEARAGGVEANQVCESFGSIGFVRGSG